MQNQKNQKPTNANLAWRTAFETSNKIKKATEHKKNLEYLISTAEKNGKLYDVNGNPNGLDVKFLKKQLKRIAWIDEFKKKS